MTDQTPRTEAGRRLLAGLDGRPGPVTTADILAIEAQARAEALDVEHVVRVTVHACRGRLLTAPADENAAVRAVLAILAGETE